MPCKTMHPSKNWSPDYCLEGDTKGMQKDQKIRTGKCGISIGGLSVVKAAVPQKGMV